MLSRDMATLRSLHCQTEECRHISPPIDQIVEYLSLVPGREKLKFGEGGSNSSQIPV